MVGRYEVAVHRVGNDSIGLHRLRHGHGPLHGGLVQPRRHHVDRCRLDARAHQDLAERNAGPLGDGIGAVTPRASLRHLSLVLLEEDAPVARALDEARHRHRRHAQQLVVADAQRVLHARPLHAQPPRLGVDDGCRPVVADVEQRCGRQVSASVQVLPACLHADVVMEEQVLRRRLDVGSFGCRLGCHAASSVIRRGGIKKPRSLECGAGQGCPSR